jgi:hypothetical protein
MRVPEEPVCIDLFRQNPVFTSLHLKSPVHVHRLRMLALSVVAVVSVVPIVSLAEVLELLASFSDVALVHAVDGVLVAFGISVCCWRLLADLLLLAIKVLKYFFKISLIQKP